MSNTSKVTARATDERLISTWTRATEQVFERLTKVKSELRWATQPQQAATAEDQVSVEWWEAQYEEEGHYRVWVGVPASAAVELGRLAHAVATADDRDPQAKGPSVEETMRSLCEAFGGLLSRESGQAIQYRGLERLPAPPSPEIVYSTEIPLPSGTALPILVGFNTAMKTSFDEVIGQLPSGSQQRAAALDLHGPLEMLLGLELPLSIRFGRTQLPLERVLELRVGSMLELEGSHDDPVDLLVNGRVVARGEVVAVDGNYGVRILEITGRDVQPAAPGPEKETK